MAGRQMLCRMVRLGQQRAATSMPARLRSLPALLPRTSIFRAFATSGGGKKVITPKQRNVTESLVKKLSEEIEHEEGYAPENEETELPKDWAEVDMNDLIGKSEGFVVVERTFKNEKICVLTSTQVLDQDQEDEEDDEDYEEGDEPPGVDAVALMLIAITKPSHPDIQRIHIGSGLSGLHDEMRGPASVLYHAYMAHRHETAGAEVEGREPGDDAIVTSPDFDSLDPDLQELWEKYLMERGITEELCKYLLDRLEAREQERYVDFLGTSKAWLSAK